MRWWVKQKRMMFVTGGSGFLGRHLLPASEAGRWELYAPSSRLLDVRSRDRVLQEVAEWKPDVIVHLAYRRDDPQVIVGGSRNMAEAAAAAGARFIHLSTDVVFAGRPQAYTEDDVPDATIPYGRWKADAEAAVRDAHPGALIVRTSLLYGTEHVAPNQRDVLEAVAGRTTTRFFIDEYRCPAHAADVAEALVTLADRPDVTGVLHVAGPQALSRADFARAVAEWYGHRGDDVPTGVAGADHPERPGVVVLDCGRAAALGIACRPVDLALAR